jgi:hypothetical protein
MISTALHTWKTAVKYMKEREISAKLEAFENAALLADRKHTEAGQKTTKRIFALLLKGKVGMIFNAWSDLVRTEVKNRR